MKILAQNGTIRERKKPVSLTLRKETGFLLTGDKGSRTPGLRIANASLYQLSYIPESAANIQLLWVTKVVIRLRIATKAPLKINIEVAANEI